MLAACARARSPGIEVLFPPDSMTPASNRPTKALWRLGIPCALGLGFLLFHGWGEAPVGGEDHRAPTTEPAVSQSATPPRGVPTAQQTHHTTDKSVTSPIPPSRTIRGVVLDQYGKPLRGVELLIWIKGSRYQPPLQRVRVGEAGEFRFENLEPRKFSLHMVPWAGAQPGGRKSMALRPKPIIVDLHSERERDLGVITVLRSEPFDLDCRMLFDREDWPEAPTRDDVICFALPEARSAAELEQMVRQPKWSPTRWLWNRENLYSAYSDMRGYEWRFLVEVDAPFQAVTVVVLEHGDAGYAILGSRSVPVVANGKKAIVLKLKGRG